MCSSDLPLGNHLDALFPPDGPAFAADDRSAATVADWVNLFGSIDLCDCDHCKSLYSPAAYFVDVLRFLDGPKGAASPLQVFLEGRHYEHTVDASALHADEGRGTAAISVGEAPNSL